MERAVMITKTITNARINRLRRKNLKSAAMLARRISEEACGGRVAAIGT